MPARQFNEIEFLTVSKSLKKHDYNLFIASDTVWLCEGINGLKVKADMNILNIHENNFSGLVLIGGAGAKKYWNNSLLHNISKKFNQQKKVIAAICSAPVIFAKSGILNGITATCFFEDRMELINAGADYKNSQVVVRKNIITANGPNASLDFTEAIIFCLNEQLQNSN